MPLPSGPAAQKIGLVLCRIVVPLWIVTGVVFKVLERTPRLLPPTVFDLGVRKAGFDPHLFLATLIALEILAVAVMIFIGRYARAMAIFMMSSFCLILLAELFTGNFKHCGCLGAASPPPWLMLAIDGTLLVGVLLFRPPRSAASPQLLASPAALGGALAMALLGSTAAYGWVLQAAKTPKPIDNGAQIDPGAPTLPAVWYVDDASVWIGKSWREVDILRFLEQEPKDIDGALRYVVFYGRTCDHCEDMFYFDLVDPGLGALVTAVEVPASTTKLRSDGAWGPMPQTDCELLELPIGTDWVITTPLVITIENGIVTCAEEGDHAACMGL